MPLAPQGVVSCVAIGDVVRPEDGARRASATECGRNSYGSAGRRGRIIRIALSWLGQEVWVLGAKFFSQRTPGRTGDARGQVGASGIGLEGLDHRQALVLGALRRAAGAPVSYAEFREAGVEFPASVVSELELAGVAIERCFGEGRGAVGVRLDPANDRAARDTPDPERPIPTRTEPELAWNRVRDIPSIEPRRAPPQGPGHAVATRGARRRDRRSPGPGSREAVPGQPQEPDSRRHGAPGCSCGGGRIGLGVGARR